MELTSVILFLVVVSLWFFANEYTVLFGIYVPTCSLKRIHFKSVVAAVLLSAVFLASVFMPERNQLAGLIPCSIDGQSLMAVLLSALIILVVLKFFSISGSSVYAVLGGLAAYMISSGEAVDYMYIFSFVAAPLMAFALSAVIRYITTKTLDRCHIHLITLSFYMRLVIIVGIVLSAFSLGMNWGGFLLAGSDMIASDSSDILLVLTVLALAIVCLSPFMRKGSDTAAGRYEDFSVYTILSVGLSVSVVMLVFSFDAATALLGLRAAPLSPSSLIFAAIAGAEVVRRTKMVERDEYTKEALALILTPSGSLVIAYVIFALTGDNESFADFTVMAAASLMLACLAFAEYVRRQKMQKQATERLVYSQQQQIYEHSRALHDMEMKVILAENQALHSSIEMKKQEVRNVALSIVEQKEYLESLNSIVKKLSKTKDEGERDMLIAELKVSLRQRLSYDRDVDSQYFAAQAENIHEDFNAKMMENFPDLTQQERRLATLLRLGFSSKYIATLMNITPKSVEISRYRLRQKLGLSKGDNLVNFIKSI